MPSKPTVKQLNYLKSLADRSGLTFTYPRTAAQASQEIDRLKGANPSLRTERYFERKAIADQIATGPLDAARVREDEISGRGSSATWVQNRDPGPAVVSDRPAPRRTNPVAGPRTDTAPDGVHYALIAGPTTDTDRRA